MFDEPGSARQEAERLVAAVLAAATMAANANPKLSTGSAECCVCPLCKVIAAVRDPDPQMVERLATGAGDLAAAVASFLRHVAAPSSTKDTWHTATRDSSPATATGLSTTDATSAAATGWPDETSGATTAGRTKAGPASAAGDARAVAASRGSGVRPGASSLGAGTAAAAASTGGGAAPAPKKPVVKKALAKKAAPGAVPKAAVSKVDDSPKKTVAKKAARKKEG